MKTGRQTGKLLNALTPLCVLLSTCSGQAKRVQEARDLCQAERDASPRNKASLQEPRVKLFFRMLRPLTSVVIEQYDKLSTFFALQRLFYAI